MVNPSLLKESQRTCEIGDPISLERALRVEHINRQLAEQNGDSTGNPRYSAFDPVMPQLEVDRAIAEVLEKRAKRYGTE